MHGCVVAGFFLGAGLLLCTGQADLIAAQLIASELNSNSMVFRLAVALKQFIDFMHMHRPAGLCE
jgi:hypothetical protein